MLAMAILAKETGGYLYADGDEVSVKGDAVLIAHGFDPLHLTHLSPSTKGGHTVVRPLISQFSQIQEHLFQGSSLLARFNGFSAQPSGEPGSKLIKRTRRMPCWVCWFDRV